MITCGGDAGWRFSNGEEWHSMEYTLLFDAEKWDMDKIAEAMRTLWRLYWAEPHGFYLSDTLRNGEKHIIPFIENSDGVYAWKGKSFGILKDEKLVEPSEDDVVVSWEKDGNTRNWKYDK